MKTAMTSIGLLLLLVAAPAMAGTVYRCDSPDGGRSYSSKPIAGASCIAASTYKASPVRASRASPVVATASSGAVTPSLTTSPPVSPTPASWVPPSSAAQTNSPRLVRGQIYSYIQDGVRHYTSAKPRGAAVASVRTIKYSYMETCYACAANPGVNFNTLRLNTNAYQAEIAAASKLHGVDEAIVRAIIHAESAFNPRALSRAGAQGLMQLMPATARRFGVGNSYDAVQNISGGVQYLAWLLKRFNGNLTLAAAGYNAGEGAVDKYKGVPPYSETRRYVERVGTLAERYRGTLAANR